MNIEQVEVSYKGRTEVLKFITTPTAFIMEPEPADHRHLKRMGVARVEQSPDSKITRYYGKTSKEERVGPGVRTFRAGIPGNLLEVYNPDEEPARFIIDWRLHGAALLKDQEVDGAKLSDWCFFDAQIKAIHRSTLWGLRNKLGLGHKEAMRWANRGSDIFRREVLLTRGCDLSKPIPESDALNDAEIMRHQAMKEFHASQTKRF